MPETVHSRNWSRELLEQPFDDSEICVQMRTLLVLFLVFSKFLPTFASFNQFLTNPAATVIRATGHQMVSLCPSVCEEKRAQMLCPLMNS